MTRIFLGDKPSIRSALENKVRDMPFIRLGISDRCISIFGKTYNYKTGFSWDFAFKSIDVTHDDEDLDSVVSISLIPSSS